MPTIPQREETLARKRSRKGKDQQEVKNGLLREVTLSKLEPPEEWHELAQMIFNSTKNSGQADWYQDSDWAVLYSLCEDIHYYKTPSKAFSIDKKSGEVREYEKPRSGQMLQSIMSNLASLLLTEGERRRARLELTRAPEEKPDLKVVAMEKYRKDLAAG